jgi:hypothetical protein
MTRASESASSNLQTSQSGSLAFARWPQSNCPYAGSGTAARRGTVASTGDREGADGEPGGGAGTLFRATTEAVAGAAAILVGSRADTVAIA